MSQGKSLTPAEAGRLILSRVTGLPAERVALPHAAGRILRQDVEAERDNPPFDRVCMDGVAVASAAYANGARSFRIQGTQAAGAVPMTLAAPDAAIEVMTGAVMPHGTDAVIPLEEYELAQGQLTLRAEATAEPWRNVQRRGSDSQPGVPMLTSGMRLGAAELAVVASAGLAEVSVGRQPRITVVSTGDELIEPGQPIADHQVRRSNAYAVAAALRLHGFAEVVDEHLRDEEALMRQRLGAALESRDVLVLSGGVSKGKFDFVPAALKALGVEEVFYQVAQRPGRPMWFGIGPRGQLVFGLPGNPVSTLVCLHRYVLPALRAAMGAPAGHLERLALTEAISGRKMAYFMPVALVAGPDGATRGRPQQPQGSGDFLALAGTAGFVELPPQADGYPEGFIADLYRW
ncbi:MAG TPA: molybdopterin molybdotransferase MoeA [Steroidobacteraceae bacterium]|nr:molybdopterin molybdotransferase MoeA [Steroidobacteraceae bacterium]